MVVAETMGTGGRDVEQLFSQNQEREQELRTLLRTRPSESRDVQALRGEIRAAYSHILGMDPEFCANEDVELLLWKNCYYKRIEDFRKRLRKYAHLASSLERARAFEAREHLHGICQAFCRFLAEAADFYASLLRRFEAMHHQYVKGGGGSDSGRGSGSVGNSVGSEQRRGRLLRLVVLSINRCLIFLGDLARYREFHGENSVKDWSTAERFYHQALAVLPTSGNPHNQLAVLATYNDAECVSVYRYCRSLMIESPFQTAHENLTLLFEKNKQKGFALSLAAGGTEGSDRGAASGGGGSSRDLGASGSVTSTLPGGSSQHHGKGKGKGSGGRGNTGALLKSFLRRFVRLHGMIFSGRADELEDFPSIFETAIADFRTLLSNSAFGDALLLKMVVICIFSVTHVAAVRNPGGSNSSASTAPDYNVALAEEAFSNAGSGIETSSGDGVNSERSGSVSGASGGPDAAAARKADEVRRKARLSYPLALAFGVSAQIGRHVRTQEPTHPSQGSQHHGSGGGHGHSRSHHRHGSHGSGHGGPGSDSGMMHGGGSHHHHHHSGGQHPPPAPVVVYGVDSKSRPSSNQPQPRPLGSRLLGPVVLFCDWLTAQPRFLRLAEEEKSATASIAVSSGGGSSGGGGGTGGSTGGSNRGGAMVVRVARAGGAVASVAVQEAEMRGQFWEVVQRLSATLPDQDPNNQADAIPGDPLGRRRPLKEHVELRGFLPLSDLYKQRYAMDGPAVPAVPDDCAGSVRIRGLKAFAAAVSGEAFVPAHPALHCQGDTMMTTHGRERSEYQWSEASGGSGSHLTSQSHESGRLYHDYNTGMRQGQPRSQYGRTPPGMGSGGGSAGAVGERAQRSLSGPLGTGYFTSGSSLGGGSEGGGRRSSRGPGPGPSGPPQHSRNASAGGMRQGTGPPQQHMGHGSLSRHHSQPMMPPPGPGGASSGGGGGGSDMDSSAQYAHPPLHRIHSQATGMTSLPTASSNSNRMYSSRHSDGGSVTGSRHSLESGMRHYEGGGNTGGGSSSSRHADHRGSGYHNPLTGGPGQSMASNSGSGSGSSGLSAHDTRSLGAWSAPPGRSGGGTGSVGGGGGSWAAEAEPQSSFRGDEGSGDESEMILMAPAFGATHRRRSTGGGGGPVVGSGSARDNAVRSGSGRGDDTGFGGGGGTGGSDLGSAGSPQFGSSRTSGGLLGGGLWSAGAFPAQDVALSPQAPSDHVEEGERVGGEHSLFGATPWHGALGTSGGASSSTPIATPVTTPLDTSLGSRGRSPPTSSSSPLDLRGNGRESRVSSSGYGGPDSGLGDLNNRGDRASNRTVSNQRPSEHDRSRNRSFDHRSPGDGGGSGGGGMGYLNNPFLPSQQQQQSQQQQGYSGQHNQSQDRQESMRSRETVAQQTNFGSGNVARHTASHRRQGSTNSMHSARSSPPGFSDVIPGSPNHVEPRKGGGGDGGGSAQQWGGDRLYREDASPTAETRDHQHHRRFSYSGPQVVSTGPRSRAAPPPYQPPSAQGQNNQSPQAHQQQQQSMQQSPPQQQHRDPPYYNRRASSPGITSRGVQSDDLASGGSPIPTAAGRAHPQGQGRPPSSLPSGGGGYSAGGGGAAAPGAVGTGSSTTNNNHGHHQHEDGASSIFSSNRSGHSNFSGFSGFSYTPFGGSDLGSVGGAAAGAGGTAGAGASGNSNLPWNTNRTPSSSLPKNDPGSSLLNGLPEDDENGREIGGSSGSYAAAHGATGGALGWGAVMGAGGAESAASGGGNGGGRS